MPVTESVSVVIPLGPRETSPPHVMDQLLGNHPDWQILLVATARPSWTVPSGCHMLLSPPGRGLQQNRGAGQATGSWLWFLHADSILEGNALESVQRFVQNRSGEGRQPALGYCRLRFLNDGPALTRLNAIGANIRSRWFDLPYGDQGLCLPTTWFERLGGFDQGLIRGEDLDLVVRASLTGLPVRPIGATITTSARRYREFGWLRTTWQHQLAAWRLSRQARRSVAEP